MKKFTLLYVDDEESNLIIFKDTFRRKFNIFTAISAKEGMKILDNNQIDLVLSDQRMPEMTGVEFLQYSLEKYPEPNRILITGYTDQDAIENAINKASIFQYIQKPWNENNLLKVIESALRLYHLGQENKKQREELIKEKEKAEENEKKLKEAQSLASIGSWVLDLSTNQVVWSEELYKMYGFDPAFPPPVLTKNLNLFTPESWELLSTSIAKTVETGISYKIELKTVRKDGSNGWMWAHGEAVIDSAGKTIGLRGTTQDITDRKIAEKELINAKEKAEESDQLKTAFLQNISHEIKTPLNGILGFSSILNKPNLTDAKKRHYINIIQNSGNQLMRIIDDILEISKLGTKQVKIIENEVCLNDLLLELFSIFDIKAKENKIPLYLKKELPDNESTIFSDETKLNKILSNLLENALKFTNEGFIEFGYQLKNTELEIYVKDTGIGIKKENQETIFIKFSQEEKELSKNVGGLGLGLSIAKENAELLGGKITLQSEKGKGSTFIVTIPCKPVNSEMIKNISNNDKGKITEKQDKYTILIVEDEEVNCLYLEILLEGFELNLKTLHAKHGKEAVEICKENSEIDFVLMDMKMPIMNGFEATKLIKKFRPDLSIIAQTAYSTKEEKEQAFSAGCDDFISKPISKETLYGIMNIYLITKH